jgi:hypothetical protein
LTATDVAGLVPFIFNVFDQSLERTEAIERAKKANASGLPQGVADDEDEDEDSSKEEEQCRRNWEETLGAIMQVSPEQFLPVLPQCTEKIRSGLPPLGIVGLRFT